MTKVVAVARDDVGSSVSDQKQASTNDEEVGNQSKTEDTSGEGQSRWAALSSRACRKNNTPLWMFLFFVLLIIIVGLSVGLTRRNQNQQQQEEVPSTVANENLNIFDDALALLESTPLQTKDVSGETISYREYNKGKQPHTLVVLPGFMCDDTLTSILPALPEFHDHHIIAVNPPGWHGSTMNNPVESHASNADIIMELLQVLGVSQAMAMGFSTGGGIAFYMAQRHPDKIKAAFLVHSIPLSGLRYITMTGDLVPLIDLDEMKASMMFPTDDPDIVYELFKSMSTNKEGFLPRNHKLVDYMIKAAQDMPGKVDVAVVNAKFNVCPIKTRFGPPSDELSTLESRVVVIHGSEDFIVPWEIVEPVTRLAIIEQWAPQGMLSLYDDGAGHLSAIDKPRVLAKVYRRALEEQILVQ
jgi:pimeloyl-ACP methyl ester carboxylesterase